MELQQRGEKAVSKKQKREFKHIDTLIASFESRNYRDIGFATLIHKLQQERANLASLIGNSK